MKIGKMSIINNLEMKGISVNMELANGTIWMTKSQKVDLLNVYVVSVTSNLSIIDREDPILYNTGRKEMKF